MACPCDGRIFTLFHEYAHLLLRAPGICTPNLFTKTVPRSVQSRIERFCDQFAGEFLVPTDSLRDLLERENIDIDTARKILAKRWKVSRQVLYRQLHAAEVISKPQMWAWLNRIAKSPAAVPKQRARGGGERADDRCRHELGPSFTRLVLTAQQRDLIPTSEAAEYLSLKLPDLERLSAPPTRSRR